MGRGRTSAKRGGVVRRLIAAAMAVCLHLLIFLGLGRAPSQLNLQTSRGDDASAISVVMVRPPPVRGPSNAAPNVKIRLRDRQDAAVAPVPAIMVPISPPAPANDAPAPNPDASALQKTLRGLVGCADPAAYRLSPQERANCDHRTAPPSPVHFQLDPQEQAAFDADAKDPLLVRKPHNGCLPRAGDRKSAVASVGHGASMAATTTAGMGCAWSF